MLDIEKTFPDNHPTPSSSHFHDHPQPTLPSIHAAMNPTISSLKPKHRLGMQSACLAWAILALMGSFNLSIQAQTPQELDAQFQALVQRAMAGSQAEAASFRPLAESLENADEISEVNDQDSAAPDTATQQTPSNTAQTAPALSGPRPLSTLSSTNRAINLPSLSRSSSTNASPAAGSSNLSNDPAALPNNTGSGNDDAGNNTIASPGSQNGIPDVAGLLAAAAGGVDAAAEGEEAEDNLHSFNFPAMPFEPIFSIYSELTGKMVLYSPELTGTVNLVTAAGLELTTEEAVEAITTSLALANVVLVPMGEKFVKAVPKEEAIQHAPEMTPENEADIPQSGVFLTRTVRLSSSTPSEVAEILRPMSANPDGMIAIDSTQILILHDYAVNIRQMLDVIQKIDIEPELDYSLEVIPIKYSKVTDLYGTMNALISGGGAATGTGMAGGVNGGSMGMGGMGMGGMGMGGMGMGGFGSMGMGGMGRSSMGGFGRSSMGGFGRSSMYGGGYRPFQSSAPVTVRSGSSGSNSSVSSNRSSFQDRLRQVIDKAADGEEEIELLANARIVPDERSNSLLIFANKQDLTMITNMVSKVDVLLAQVLIEAVVLEVEIGDDQSTGVKVTQSSGAGDRWQYGGAIPQTAADGSAITEAPNTMGSVGFNYLMKYTSGGDTLSMAIDAIATESTTQVVQRPRIQTSHGIPGFFTLADQIPYVSGGSFGGFSNFAQSFVQFIQVGLQLSVQPFITPEGYIVMEIMQNIDIDKGLVEVSTGDNRQSAPRVNQRSASSTLTVRDGDTIMLGGFIKQSQENGNSGVPLLKDIPVLGNLFKSKSRKNTSTELIILLRATVLETPEEAAMMARQEKQSLPGIRDLEQTLGEETQKRSDKLLRSRK